MDAAVLAQEGIKNPNVWYPVIVGVLVVVAAVGLFIGTIYLLLATNLGARLGFLITIAGLSGMLVLISSLWLTTTSPLNTLKGRIPSWVAVESIKGGNLADSTIPEVRSIDKNGHQVDVSEQANVKAALDEALVAPTPGAAGAEVAGTVGKYQIYKEATDYIVKDTVELGGGNVFSQTDVETNGSFPFVHISLHKPLYAVVTICPVDQNALIVPFGETPPAPTCDASQPVQSLVFLRNLGSVRVPPFIVLVSTSILFALSLLSLHWRERDLQEKARAEAAAAASASPVPQTV